MRPLLSSAFALLALAACDTSRSSDTPFVGSWTLAEARAETVVQSRTDQSLLVLSEPGTGHVSITGDQTHTLTRARYSAEPAIGQILALEPESQPPGAFRFTTLVLGRSTNDQGVARSSATFEGITADGSRTRTYRADLPSGTAPFVRDGDRLAVPAVTMSDGEGRTVTASGALTFLVVQARAGQDVSLPADGAALPTGGSVTFGSDGRVVLIFGEGAGSRTEHRGTWTEAGPGRVSLDLGPAAPTEFDVEVSRGELRLTESASVAASCAAAPDCLATVEDEVLAGRGTLASARRTTTYVYRSR